MSLKTIVHLIVAVVITLFLPYALFGKHKKLARSMAVINGIEISLALIFLEPLFLIANPFLVLLAVSPIWKKMNHAPSK